MQSSQKATDRSLLDVKPIKSLLQIGEDKVDASSGNAEQTNIKPKICKLPQNDLFSRMKAFRPILNGSSTTPAAPNSVKFVPIDDEESSDSGTDDETDDSRPHVEMRLAVVADSDSSCCSSDTEECSTITVGNIKLPGSNAITNHHSQIIQELD